MLATSSIRSTMLLVLALSSVIAGSTVVLRGVGNQANADCDAKQRELASEYSDRSLSSRRIECSEFADSGDSRNFTWEQLVGGSNMRGVENGKHSPWGLMSASAINGVDQVYDVFYDKFGLALVVSSGFRCPQGNSDVGSKLKNSAHMFGEAVDIDVEGLETGVMTQPQHSILVQAIENSGGTVPNSYAKYSQSLTHVHAHWK